MTMVIAASRDRPNESSNAERVVALMKRPPVLQRMAAPTTRRRGDELRMGPDEGAFVSFIFHLRFQFWMCSRLLIGKIDLIKSVYGEAVMSYSPGLRAK